MQTEKRKASQKAYRDSHKDSYKDYQKAYRDSHKEELKEYRELHKEEINTRSKQYSESHKDELKAYRELHKDERKAYYKAYHKAHYKESRDPNSNRMGSIEARINHSCIMRHINIEDFNGFADKRRPHIKPIHDCIKINEYFEGSNAHHITKSIIIYIPKELHQHINHNIKTGDNMGEINALSIQFVNGGL